jgi:hypothetical protein
VGNERAAASCYTHEMSQSEQRKMQMSNMQQSPVARSVLPTAADATREVQEGAGHDRKMQTARSFKQARAIGAELKL